MYASHDEETTGRRSSCLFPSVLLCERGECSLHRSALLALLAVLFDLHTLPVYLAGKVGIAIPLPDLGLTLIRGTPYALPLIAFGPVVSLAPSEESIIELTTLRPFYSLQL